MSGITQECIDNKNRSFWNELCGTQLAKQLGIVDASPESLGKFDDFYMDYYPYLNKYLFLDKLKDKNILEVGLGFGTMSQLLAMSGAKYHGLDIAPNAVAMANHRLQQNNLKGDVRVGSMLECPFPDEYFDFVISIGCFHHTGDLQRCVDQSHRVLKKNGTAIVMVYNKFSWRQWANWPRISAQNLINQTLGKKQQASNEAQRKAYDASAALEGAPETQFFSVKEIHTIFHEYSHTKVHRENCDDLRIILRQRLLCHMTRKWLLNSAWARYLGLDLYIVATK